MTARRGDGDGGKDESAEMGVVSLGLFLCICLCPDELLEQCII